MFGVQSKKYTILYLIRRRETSYAPHNVFQEAAIIMWGDCKVKGVSD